MSRKWVISVEEFADRMEISVRTAYRMIADGKGPRTIRVRGVIRIPVTAFERWLDGQDDPGESNGEPVAS